jgi:hypothetical protein
MIYLYRIRKPPHKAKLNCADAIRGGIYSTPVSCPRKPVSNQEKPSLHTVPEVPEYGGVSWIELVCLVRKLGKLETGHQVENQTGGNCGSSDRSTSAADMTSFSGARVRHVLGFMSLVDIATVSNCGETAGVPTRRVSKSRLQAANNLL